MVAAENAARNPPGTPEPASASEQTMSRDQIAQSLAGKDPSWFRQTADPGRGSATFRKSQVEDQDTVDMPSTRTQLPGMARESTAEPSKESPASRPATPTVSSKLGSPLSLTGSQRLDPPTGDAAGDADSPSAGRQSVTSPPGRTSPTRPRSPTKGMGGFVQSAMMKRSDSARRWSVNSQTGLQRADSARSSVCGSENSQRAATPKSGARPASTQGEGSEQPAQTPATGQEKDEAENEGHAGVPASNTPAESKSKEDAGKTTPPSSPSKGMDPRRWSSTKSSSWLEAALNKPESPKTKSTPPAANQPAWMVELNKARAQKANAASVDSSNNSTAPKKPEIKTGGLLRSTPMGANLKPSHLRGFPSVPPVSTEDSKPLIAELRGNLRKASPTTEAASTEGQGDSEASAKSKPEAPQKIDFRANLKPRPPPPESKGKDPAEELKNVVGSLRKTRTQTPAASDEPKDSILRGKAALHPTGGSVGTERKDDFKDTILKKKEDLQKAQQDGRSVTKEASPVSDKPVLEGIVKKLELNRTGSLSKQTPTTTSTSTSTTTTTPAPELPLQSPSPTDTSRSSHVSASPKPGASDQTSDTTNTLKPAAEITKEPAANSDQPAVPRISASIRARAQSRVGALAERFNPGLASLIARGPPAASGPPKSSGVPGAARSTGADVGEPTGPGPQLTHLTKNRARGPRRKAPTTTPLAIQENLTKQETAPEPEKKSASSPDQPEPLASSTAEQSAPSSPEKPVASPKPENSVPPKSDSPPLPEFRRSWLQDKPKPTEDVASSVDPSKRTAEDEPSPTSQPDPKLGSSPDKVRARSPTKVHEQVAALAALSQQSPKHAAPGSEAGSQPPSPKKLDMKRMSRFLDEQSQPSPKPEPVRSRPSSPVKDRFPALASPQVGKLPGSLDEQSQPSPKPDPVRSRPGSPVKDRFPALASSQLWKQPGFLGEQSQPSPKPEPVRSRPTSPIKDRFPALASPSPQIGKQSGSDNAEMKPALPIRSGPSWSDGRATSPKPAPEGPSRPTKTPPNGDKPLPPPPADASPRVPSPTRSPAKQASDASTLLNDFFGPDRPKRKYRADAADILMQQLVSTAKVQTQRAQLFQLSAEGKKVPVPAHYERVLFEREMYLCPHTFIDSAGRKVSEVYFWAGDEVPESEVDDAHLFAAREARAFGGRLVKLVQGKETSEFLQALGGIVIIRRGSSNKYDSLAPNMLCGRRYLGQVAFDEVDFSPMSLCSGFPYLITQQGKCYLWKGKGSDVEELGCARLVGMELALMGELIEVEEGSEPDNFWDIFGGGTRPSSADHWRLKPNYDKYRGRLFCASGTDKHQVGSDAVDLPVLSPPAPGF